MACPGCGAEWECEVNHKKVKLNLPRAPLPRQKGGAHRVATKQLLRKVKHRKRQQQEEL